MNPVLSSILFGAIGSLLAVGIVKGVTIGRLSLRRRREAQAKEVSTAAERSWNDEHAQLADLLTAVLLNLRALIMCIAVAQGAGLVFAAKLALEGHPHGGTLLGTIIAVTIGQWLVFRMATRADRLALAALEAARIRKLQRDANKPVPPPDPTA